MIRCIERFHFVSNRCCVNKPSSRMDPQLLSDSTGREGLEADRQVSDRCMRE